MFEKQKEKLKKREAENTLRSLSIIDSHIDFFSNDYLGFSKLSFKHNSQIGSKGSRLLSGNMQIAEEAEEALAHYFHSTEALIFNSGYSANLSVLSCVPQRGDLILYDEFVHASIRDGIRLSFAESKSFKHNDLNELETLLKKNSKKQVYIVTEGLFSMDGDIAPLGNIVKLSNQFNALIILDEAHSAGVFGDAGRGLAHGMELHHDIPIRIVTFGKAFGFHGAVVLTNKIIKEYLINFARPFIYTTAPSVDFYDRIVQIFKLKKVREAQVKLHKNINYFRNKSSIETTSERNSPIQIYLTDKELLIEKSKKLVEHGIFTKPIFSPTVPSGQERIRLCIHSFNNFSEIELLIRLLEL